MRPLKQTLELLHRYHQRATYGAVADLVGRTPQTVLQGCPRNWLHSWVVNQQTGEPTAYPAGLIHPALREHPEILRTGSALAAWLDSHADALPAGVHGEYHPPPAA
ncbi:MAG TPA: hypothetical protein VJN95_13585 [Gemmatimonadales bacterium]|nr:hypothetical protein [Gemmatimonadales bacterium]